MTKVAQGSSLKSWYIVFISAMMGCTLAAAYPQFSMTVGKLSAAIQISEETLLFGDTVKSMFIVISMLVSGAFYKKLGTYKLFILALVCTTLPQFAVPFSPNVPIFFVLKAMQGFSSIIFPVFLLIIMDTMEEKKTGLATAIFNGVFYGGGGIGGTFAGFVIAKSTWTMSFYALGLVQLAVGLLWLLTVRVSTTAKEEEISEKSKGSSGIFSRPIVWLLIVAFFSTTWTIQAITVDMPLFGAFLGYDELSTGKILTASTIGMIASCLVSGKASDFMVSRTENKARGRILVLMMGPFIILASIAVLLLANLQSFTVLYAATLFFSFGASWGLGSFYCTLPELFDEETLPIVTGFAGGIGDMGMPLAPLVVGVIFGVKGFWNIGWSVCGFIALLSLLSCIVLLKMQSPKMAAKKAAEQ